MGLTQGQLVRGDADGLKADLRKILAGKVQNSVLTIDSGIALQFHQIVRLQVYSEEFFTILGSSTIPHVIYVQMVEKLNL